MVDDGALPEWEEEDFWSTQSAQISFLSFN